MTVQYTHTWRLWSMAIALCLGFVMQAAPAEIMLESGDSIATAGATRESVRHRRTQVQERDNKKHKDDPEMIKAVNIEGDTLVIAVSDTAGVLSGMEIIKADSAAIAALGKKREFNPNPTTALWMSALCPGLGQVYNRRYWKLPIVVGAFVGLSYGMSWNNRMYQDYSRAYRDAMDNDPETRSYMNFYPPNVKESDLDMTWLKKALKNKKDYYRRYRDICVLSMVGVYALSIIDAYVDASLAHFDISPDLSMRLSPTVMDNEYAMSSKPSVGVQCSFNF